MASSYTDNTGIEKPGSGEQSGTWGTTTNTNFDIIDDALNGVEPIALTAVWILRQSLLTSEGSLSSTGTQRLLCLQEAQLETTRRLLH